MKKENRVENVSLCSLEPISVTQYNCITFINRSDSGLMGTGFGVLYFSSPYCCYQEAVPDLHCCLIIKNTFNLQPNFIHGQFITFFFCQQCPLV